MWRTDSNGEGFGGGCHEAHNSPFVKLCVRTRVWSGQQVVWAVISILAWPHLRSLELWGEERECTSSLESTTSSACWAKDVRGREDDLLAVETFFKMVICGQQLLRPA
ncbi:conserved hypothetical protein [Trichinella spiralis]|uniref:hypothetical protein n=1 Tax=Trichinella spiralis TaxID=6334 RepID=UPI0001EFDFDC|nr:conserved hypothetical protein [Trichinella spiralis]